MILRNRKKLNEEAKSVATCISVRGATSNMGEKEKVPVREEKPPDRIPKYGIRCTLFSAPKNERPPEERKAPKPTPFFFPYSENPVQEGENLCGQIKRLLRNKLKAGEFICLNRLNGIQVRMENKEDHQQAEQILNKSKLNYYHHEPEPDLIKKRKFVMYDLGEEDNDHIIEDLNRYGLFPLEVKKMTLKSTKYLGQANYIVYFKHDDHITLHMVMTAKYICNTSVRWAHYNPPSLIERQCENCWRPGHRKFGCHMTPRCMFCAATDHKEAECPLVLEKARLNAKLIPREHLKCCNCGGQHTAIFKFCEARVKHREKTQTQRKKSRENNATDNKALIDAPIPTSNQWTANSAKQLFGTNHPEPTISQPEAHRSRSVTRRARSLTISYSKPATRGYSRPDNNKNTSTTNRAVKSNAVSVKHNDNTNYSFNSSSFDRASSLPLLQPQEMIKIFKEIIDICGRCKSRDQQLNGLFELAAKYMPCP